VATVCDGRFSCTESRARSTSLKVAPRWLIGYTIEKLQFLVRADHEHGTKPSRLSAAIPAPRRLPLAFGWIMSYSLATFRSVSPISGVVQRRTLRLGDVQGPASMILDALSIDRPITLVLRLSNSGFSFARYPQLGGCTPE